MIGILLCITLTLVFSFQALDSCVGNTLLSASSPSVRGMDYPRNLRFVSNYQMAFARNMLLLESAGKTPYFYNRFTGVSYRYFHSVDCLNFVSTK